MTISSQNSKLDTSSIKSPSSILIAKKTLDVQKQEGQNAVSLIETAAPPVAGKGKLVNTYA